eukprot:6692664-Prymnesium_polylepis.1
MRCVSLQSIGSEWVTVFHSLPSVQEFARCISVIRRPPPRCPNVASVTSSRTRDSGGRFFPQPRPSRL